MLNIRGISLTPGRTKKIIWSFNYHTYINLNCCSFEFWTFWTINKNRHLPQEREPKKKLFTPLDFGIFWVVCWVGLSFKATTMKDPTHHPYHANPPILNTKPNQETDWTLGTGTALLRADNCWWFRNQVNFTSWVFPKIVVPPNHPF